MGEGGEGEGKKNEAGETPTPPPPVVLGMELHCAGCAKKVRKSIRHMPGVLSVVADAAANRVVVAGTADAAALKARIESKTKKPVEILSAAGPSPSKPAPAEPKKNSDKGVVGDEKKNPDKDGGGDKVQAGSSQSPPPPKEKEEKKQPPEEGKPKEAETVLLKIRLHCDACADRIRRRIYKIKGVKDVVLDGNAKDEVKVTGTMDVAAMVSYLREKLNRAVEAVAPGNKKDAGAGGGDDDKGLDKKKDKAAGGDEVKKDKGKGIEEVVGPSTAAAAASMAPAPAAASTHHVSPFGNVAYPQPQGPPPRGYYSYYGDNNANAGGYYGQHPSSDAFAGGSYYQHPGADAGAGSYYQYQQHPSADHIHNPQPYPYNFDMAPAPQMFSDENPNACSLM
ncbi:heavy metal-associated isoprenylated plant protein 3 [Brachypodium distachyon]|uniref:HMA domain-containing protein n=1 Tax=Brachypodium distachyon TaxID=15368 RepID=I1H9M6_BRADI|nr:heavy metal-associated isoprenylated plant protein 3 [Brachypodium distachyon]KQK23609.1 hypothetical protein BRADI_1g74900v3 [Brachypodium distachyon]|eukprot:XP_010229198.1 heavy metal-associated isoprenylated plant protein 3 [Brachypodium distachyon]